MKGSQAAVEMAAEPVAVECTHCGVAMTEHLGTGSRIRYFCCPSCRRWFSSTYAEIFRVDAKVRVHGAKLAASEGEHFEAVKKRLEQWLAGLDNQDPYRVLGISPGASAERVKSRYRQLALETHPDRGGSAERMKELNLAYGRIANHREYPTPRANPAGDCEATSSRPPKTK